MLGLMARPGHVLKPASLLRRFRPVRLEICAQALDDFSRRARVFGLMRRHFPDGMSGWEAMDYWFERYCDFLRCVQDADWFEVDWNLLEMYETHWMEYGDDENTGFDTCREYLIGMPVHCFGWGEVMSEVEFGDPPSIHDHPALELLRYLLIGADGRETSGDLDNLLAEVGFEETDFDSSDETLDRLARRTKRLKPPWRWLPEMARFAADMSDNIILDTTVDIHDPWPTQWTWDKDLEMIRAAWQKARPVVGRFREFTNRCYQPEALETIYYLAAPQRKRRKK